MKHSSPLNFSSCGVSHRASVFSVGSVSVTRRLDSSRGGVRAKRRSWVSSSLQHDILADWTTGEGTMDETQNSLLLQDEELRQNVERQAKRLRQLQAREIRQRSVLVDEAVQEFDGILALHYTYTTFAKTCIALRDARVAKKMHEAQQSQQWSLQLIADATREVMLEEESSRRAIAHKEGVVRETISHLQVSESRGLAFHEGVFRLVHGEQVRRAFLLREEARGVEAMNIPGFISLPCVPPTTPTKASLGIGGRHHEGTRILREVDKMDLMAAQRCPFLCAADCPYMPPQTRQLGRVWADVRQGVACTGGAVMTTDSHQQQQQRHVITEVGKQRVRYAMAKKHLRETSSFLPSLRVSI